MTIKELAKLCGGTHDGGDDGRIHFDDAQSIQVFAHLMTEKEYDAMEGELIRCGIDGIGFTAYAWNDCSGYNYWKGEGESGSSNYVQITVQIHNLRLARSGPIRKAVKDIVSQFTKYDNSDEYHDAARRA